jgi:hypothetical protein
VSRADVVVRSSDHVDFRVHQSILASSSPVFKDMFSLPQPTNNETVDGLPMVRLTEDGELLRALITMLYPIPSELPTSYDRILALLAAAQKYDMGAVQSFIRAKASQRKLSPLDVFRAYALASSWRLIPEMNMAARLSLNLRMSLGYLGDELQRFEGWALRALVKYRMLHQANFIMCLKFFLDACTSPSKIWIACPGPKAPPLNTYSHFGFICEAFIRDLTNLSGTRGPLAPRIDADGHGGSEASAPTLPMWLYDVFTNEIVSAATMAPELRLVTPSDIRAKYLSALQKHVSKDKCTPCLEVHAMEGEKYMVELERALTQARNNVGASIRRYYPLFKLLRLRSRYPNFTIFAEIAASGNSGTTLFEVLALIESQVKYDSRLTCCPGITNVVK